MSPVTLPPEAEQVYQTLRASMLAAQEAGLTLIAGHSGITKDHQTGTWIKAPRSQSCCAVGAFLLGRALLSRSYFFRVSEDAATHLGILRQDAAYLMAGFDGHAPWVMSTPEWPYLVGQRLREEFLEQGKAHS